VAVGGRAPGAGEGIPDLTGARVFEPQNGRFLGRVGREFGVCNPTEGNLCWATPQSIIMIIGDGDFYKVRGQEWIGYNRLYQKIEGEKNGSACLTCGAYN
jgi:hypothetical protein